MELSEFRAGIMDDVHFNASIKWNLSQRGISGFVCRYTC